jgi:secondary thiamine-phosphate synthase enzyme
MRNANSRMLNPSMVASTTAQANSEGAASTISQAFSVVFAVLTAKPNRPRYTLIIFNSGGSSSTIRILPVRESILVLMRFYTEYLTFKTAKHREYINITPQVETALHKSAIQEGMILVSAMHITAGVWVNDAEDGLIADIDEWLEKLAPFRKDYRHHRTGETNGDSHLKSLLIHHEVIVPVTAGKLDFGPWQQVYYAEFDGQRSKRVIIKVMGE